MYSQVIVPIDGAALSVRAIGPAVRVARACDARLVFVSFAVNAEDVAELQTMLDDILAEHGIVDAVTKVAEADDAALAIAAEVDAEPGSLVCMSSVGRAHAGHILGSVAEGVLREVSTPVLLVGPRADVEAFDLEGPMLVGVDGSALSEAVLPIATSWAIALGLQPRVVAVVPPAAAPASSAEVDSSYVHRVAERMQAQTGRPVDFEVLHRSDVAEAIVDDAIASRASVIVVSTHGQSGLRRVVAGSVTMGLVHRATCPVLAYRPLQLEDFVH